mgnify:CR=1 FL=1
MIIIAIHGGFDNTCDGGHGSEAFDVVGDIVGFIGETLTLFYHDFGFVGDLIEFD